MSLYNELKCRNVFRVAIANLAGARRLLEKAFQVNPDSELLSQRKSPLKLWMFSTVLAVLLMNLISLEARAQDENASCPCFNYEEIESIFVKGVHPTEEVYRSDCSAQDYTVEFIAEVTVWDQDYTTVAQARVEWSDYDPGGCEYIDTLSDSGVERNIRWPDPAPEAPARACFNIISSVIAKSDTSGKCNTYQ